MYESTNPIAIVINPVIPSAAKSEVTDFSDNFLMSCHKMARVRNIPIAVVSGERVTVSWLKTSIKPKISDGNAQTAEGIPVPVAARRRRSNVRRVA